MGRRAGDVAVVGLGGHGGMAECWDGMGMCWDGVVLGMGSERGGMEWGDVLGMGPCWDGDGDILGWRCVGTGWGDMVGWDGKVLGMGPWCNGDVLGWDGDVLG